MNQSQRGSMWVSGGLLALGLISYIPFVIFFGVENGSVTYSVVLASLSSGGMLLAGHYAWAAACATFGLAAALYGQTVIHYFIWY